MGSGWILRSSSGLCYNFTRTGRCKPNGTRSRNVEVLLQQNCQARIAMSPPRRKRGKLARFRVEKAAQRKVADLEAHLFLLRDHLYRLGEDLAHLKALAAELRVLVCWCDPTEGLLWRLAEKYQVSDEVEVHLPGRVNPDHPLSKGLKLGVAYISRPDPSLAPRLPCGVYILREVIKRAEAVYSLGRSYTHEQLVRAIAEQMGAAHEDEGVEPALGAMEDLLIQGVAPYVRILSTDAELVLEVGQRVIATAEREIGYQRQRLGDPVSLSLHLRLRELPLGRVALGTFRAYVAGVTVDIYLGPRSVAFVVSRHGSGRWEVTAPLPEDWKAGSEAAFSLGYDPRQKKMQALSPGAFGHVVLGCDLGFLDPRDVRFVEAGLGREPYVYRQAFYVHSRLFSADEVKELPGLLIQPPIIQAPEG